LFQSFSNQDEPLSKASINGNRKSIKLKLISDYQTKIIEAKEQINEILQQDKSTQSIHHDFIKQHP
jgi:membrane-anchored protein YejM (alkaline phosphatase superfamily)